MREKLCLNFDGVSEGGSSKNGSRSRKTNISSSRLELNKKNQKCQKEKANTNSTSSLLDPNKKEIAIDHQAVSVHRKAKGTTLEIYLNASSKPVSVVNVFFLMLARHLEGSATPSETQTLNLKPFCSKLTTETDSQKSTLKLHEHESPAPVLRPRPFAPAPRPRPPPLPPAP
jgi:hypothetical protein